MGCFDVCNEKRVWRTCKKLNYKKVNISHPKQGIAPLLVVFYSIFMPLLARKTVTARIAPSAKFARDPLTKASNAVILPPPYSVQGFNDFSAMNNTENVVTNPKKAHCIHIISLTFL